MSEKKGFVRKDYNFPIEICKKIEELAEEKGVSNTEAVIDAVLFKYNADIVDEHILLGRMTQLQKKLDHIDKKVETISNLICFAAPYLLALHPKLPKDKTEANLQLLESSKIFKDIVDSYRNWLKSEKISFMQSIFGDSQESLQQTFLNDSLGQRDING